MSSWRVEKLDRHHDLTEFDCGQSDLNRFLQRFALSSQQANTSQTWLGLHDGVVVGYYTLVVAQVLHADAPERLTKGIAAHPVPIMLLARLAVDARWQGKGAGSGLLKNAMLRTLQAADIAGIRALAAHAKDDSASAFYRHFGFVESPTDPLHMFLLLKDVRRAIG